MPLLDKVQHAIDLVASPNRLRVHSLGGDLLPVTHNFRFRASWGMLRTPFLSDISKSNR
jgi:hypothetical protein